MYGEEIANVIPAELYTLCCQSRGDRHGHITVNTEEEWTTPFYASWLPITPSDASEFD